MATSHRQSFKESGSDEARDNEEDPEVCSNCATDGKLQPASYFCYNCGVFGRYICGKCLTHHNRYVKSHRIKLMSNQPISRGQTLETELETERNNVEELRHKLDDSMKQIETYFKERQTLETELEAERKNVEELRHKLDDSMKQIEKYLKERQTLKRELETERKNVEELRHKLDDSMKQIEKNLKESVCVETREQDSILRHIFPNSPFRRNLSPAVVCKAKDEKDSKIANLQEQIQTLGKELEKERSKTEKILQKFNDRGKQIQGLEIELKEKDNRNKLLDDEAKDLAQSLGQEKKIRTAVENELKSAKDMVQRLEKHVNDDFVKCQDYQKRIAELEAANKKLEAAYKNLEKHKYHLEQQANKNMEQMRTILLEEKRKADDQYKKLLEERDDIRDRFSKLAGKKLQEQNNDM